MKTSDNLDYDLGYFMFLNDVIRSGAWARLSGAAKAIYPVICVHINKDTKDAFPSLNLIQKLTGLSRQSVVIGIKELSNIGLIIKVKGGPRVSNKYYLSKSYKKNVFLSLTKIKQKIKRHKRKTSTTKNKIVIEPHHEKDLLRIIENYKKELGISKIIHKQGSCPDLVLLMREGRKRKIVKAEIELKASSFYQHGHQPQIVDLIICWENDLENSPIPILECKDLLKGGSLCRKT